MEIRATDFVTTKKRAVESTNMKRALGGPVAAEKLIAKSGRVWRKPSGKMKKKV